MTASDSTARSRILVAIDIAKAKHEVLVELPNGKRRKMIVRNQLSDFRQLAAYLKRLDGALEIALEPTADYHRNLAYFLKVQGFPSKARLLDRGRQNARGVAQLVGQERSEDAQVILHLLRNENTQYFYDPLIEQTNDLQELSKIHFQVHCARRACNTVCSTITYRFTFPKPNGSLPIAGPVGSPVCCLSSPRRKLSRS